MSIVLEQVEKRFGDSKAVVDKISLEIQPGELFVLLGSSGSGKSTLLRMIAGLTTLDGGRICLNGRDVTFLPTQKRNTGFVFQNYSLFRHMTVAQNIEFGLSIRRATRQERDERVAAMLKLIQMKDYADRMPSQLSGGQQQRVALARALAHQPEVLLLDEPFGALDAKIRVQLRQELKAIQRQLGLTTILVTHDQDEAFELADRIGIIEGGHLLEVGTADELYRHPQNRFTATFLGTANLLPARRNSHQVYLGDVALTAPPNTDYLQNQAVELLSRPEEIELATSREDLNGQVIGKGIVLEINFAGPTERVTVRMPNYKGGSRDILLHVALNPNENHTPPISPNSEVWIGLKKYHLLPLY